MIGTVHRSMVGRDEELARLESFLRQTTDGFALLAIEGEAGMGKTTLWEEAVSSARAIGITTLTARPTEAESALSFVALNDLVEGVGDDVWSDLPYSRARSPGSGTGSDYDGVAGRVRSGGDRVSSPSFAGWLSAVHC